MNFTTYKLNEIGPVCMCKRILKSETNNKGGIPFYKIGSFGKKTDVFIDKDKFELYKSKYPYPKKGDVLISAAGSIGKTVIFDGKDSYFQDSNIVWIDNDETKVLNPYLQYCYKNAKWKTTVGNTIVRLYNEGIRNTEIRVPSIPEQRKITFVLDKIQSAIDNKKQQLALLDEAVKSEFVEKFGENPVESGKWKVEKIASVVDKNILSVKKKFQKTDTIKYVDISAIDNISNVVTGFTEYVLLEAPSRAQQVINQNDILISTVRPNLRNIAINPFNDNFIVGSSGFCVLRVNDLCNAKYLFYCVLNDDFTNAMVDLTTGAAYPAIKDSDILAYPIALPPLDLQNQFATFVQQIDKSKFVIKQQIVDLQELLDSKMQEYFS